MIIGRIKNQFGRLSDLLLRSSIATRRARYEQLRWEALQRDPKALGGYGYKVFSQSDEDGIVAEIFRRIGTTSRTFVEFGVGDGLENNSAALLYDGWSGLWIEGSANFCDSIRRTYAPALASGQLKLTQAFATPDNIDALISGQLDVPEIDLLSVDIDGNDAHVLQRIRSVRPRMMVLEYNAKFGPSLDYCMAYDGEYGWRKSDRFGASLKHFERLAKSMGFSCVGCNLVGTNAFFVRDDLLGGHFVAPYTSERHYEPARYELVGLPSGHPCSPDTFKTRLVA